MVRITDVEERVVHWVLAASCLFCVISGIGLMYHSWSFIPTLLGGYYATKLMHIYSGVIFAGMLVYSWYMWKKDCEFEESDLQWVLKAAGFHSHMKKPVATMTAPQAMRHQKNAFWPALYL
ncbi:MAG TPA: cytochrome b/b6 domain-containing protein [Desulfomonilia bacterium]|nr:cytochrome b/b6 domain-containing protein [Desulfomonilia bacterium]